MKTTVFFLLILIYGVAVFPHISLAQDTRPIVRIIYFLPNDRQPDPDVDAKLDALIKRVQRFYADEMERHGFGRKTFLFETDTGGNAMVHHVKGKFSDKHYNVSSIIQEIIEQFDTSKHIYAVHAGVEFFGYPFAAGNIAVNYAPMPGSNGPRGGPLTDFAARLTPVTAHELGHTFGLGHDYRSRYDVMHGGFLYIAGELVVTLPQCAAEWLDAHRAFNPVSSSVNADTTMEILQTRLVSSPNTIHLSFEVSDPDGLHQVQLLTPEVNSTIGELIACKRLNGNPNRTIEFVTSNLTPQNKAVFLQIIDIQGNMSGKSFPIDITRFLPRSEVVAMPDANLAALVRETLNLDPNGTLTTHAMLNLTSLLTGNREIIDITGLEHAANLRLLGFYNNSISDVAALAGLTRLVELNLGYNNISDVTALAGLTQLTHLDLYNNTISDVSPLSSSTELISLGLQNNAIADISSLMDLIKLKGLYLSSNAITDISPLIGLTQLKGLYLSSNAITDISPLIGLTQLKELHLSSNIITDVSPLSGLTQLTSLDLGWNAIFDVSPLSALKQLTVLNLSSNNISDVSPLSALKQLTQLYLGNNNISDVSPLVELSLTGTQWDSTGLYIQGNSLNYASLNTHIPTMQAKGVEVQFDQRTPTTLVKISGTAQEGITNTVLPLPFVVEVRDQQHKAFAGVPVTFRVTAGGGKLSAATTETDAAGRAKTHLTLGRTPGTNTVRVTATEISQPAEFTAIGTRLTASVAIPDTNLRTRIAEALGKAEGYTITVGDMLRLTELTANNANIFDLTGLQQASNLTTLVLDDNTISDIPLLAGLPRLTKLSLNSNNISDIAPVAELTHLETLSIENNNISDVTPLAALTELETLLLENNAILDVAPLEALTELKTLRLRGNLLSYPSLHTVVPAIQAGGATVTVDARVPTTLIKVSGTRGVAGEVLPLIVEVQDEHGFGFAGVPVTFSIIAGGGSLSTVNVITDHTGRAGTTFTLGTTPGKYTVRAAVTDAPRPVNFTLTAIDANARVAIPDVNLRAKIAETLSKPKNATLNAGDLLELTNLDAPNANIQDLTGLEHAHNLNDLNLNGEYISGEGWVNSNRVSDFSPLFGLAQLGGLRLTFNSLSDVSFLSELNQLATLNLWGNTITDISPLSGLPRLTFLNIGSNNISDISPLSGLTQLRSLELSDNSISDISPLSGLPQLTNLRLWNNSISDISPLSGLPQLTFLYLGGSNISDISSLSGLTQLTNLGLGSNNISDISSLSGLTQLRSLELGGNSISDVLPLSGLTQLTNLSLWNNSISDISPLSGLTQLTVLNLRWNAIFDISPLVGLNLTGTQWGSTGLYLQGNPLNYASLNTHIPAMQAKGVEVQFDRRTYPALDIISGTGQHATGGDTLANPFVVAAIDKSGTPMRDVSVTFAVVEGTGELTATTATTDARGRAETTLTVGTNPGRHRVRATAPTLGSSVPFIAIATAPAPAARFAADVNADGVVNIQDLVLVSSRLGQTGQNVADVNGDGAVNIQDLVLVAGELGTEAAAPSAWHYTSGSVPARATVEQWLIQAYQLSPTDVRSQRGILLLERLFAALVPKETALLANYPNPFNPETWIPYQLAKPADVTLTIYAVNGQVVRQLSLGYQLAGTYQSRSRAAYWDGRNAQGERVASGVYFYTLSAGEFTATHKMLIRK